MPLALTQARFSHSAETRGRGVLDKPVFAGDTYHRTLVADMSHTTPRNTTLQSISLHVHNSCTTQFSCILIDRHRIEPLANLAPHLEELDMLASWGWLWGCLKGWLRDRLGFLVLGNKTVIHNVFCEGFSALLLFTHTDDPKVEQPPVRPHTSPLHGPAWHPCTAYVVPRCAFALQTSSSPRRAPASPRSAPPHSPTPLSCAATRCTPAQFHSSNTCSPAPCDKLVTPDVAGTEN